MDVRSGHAISRATSGDLKLYYEDMGDPDDPPVLLIMGLGAQLLLWRTGFCERLVAQGLRVIRYDNRDVGLSSRTEHCDSGPSMPARLLRFWFGLRNQAAYSLEDMADDAAALLDHLGIEHAHIVGASMGGMIAQIFAARFPERTKALAIICSSNNRACLRPPAVQALRAMLSGPPPGSPRDVVVDNVVRVTGITGSRRYRLPEERIRAEAAENYDRSFDPLGVSRQFNAVLGSGSLRHYNRRIAAPTVVIHGRKDIMVRPSNGRAVARAIDDARLVLFDGMGHDLPEPLWDGLISVLMSNFARAG
ncbi:alpha/beta fold hydrolase [Mycobacterium kansasii]|uniref:Hydrolase n=3 Tax=Mycobacterium kansasii TaxID=1768 RepID=A0A1V3WG96_MYCKA|nr:alpha/beta hydrolase [Mycobacterium kansasii]EUA03912.1 alpha/beta hydrolase fold family protein [Mycobacterium kansasii 824]AGZ52215.1 hydrolase [Mycobacterium kansasii ATCC 12478]ARG56093.1 alpha/beta hydrolase [Mycobacterium kansasii]ARG61421.1 alpha/beta hydrolase [Mycobacterium kansasii]ARG69230.1 alpha/beta hydrolase [Mycobacterium kansasii]